MANRYRDNIGYPIAVYDVDNKRCAILFSSCNKASRFLFNTKTIVISTQAILVKRKWPAHKHKLECTITCRSATPEQRTILGKEDMVILHPEYDIQGGKIKSRFNNMPGGNRIVKSVYSEERDQQAVYLGQQGYTIEEITKKLNVPKGTIQDIIKHQVCPAIIKDYTVEELQKLCTIIQNRITNIDKIRSI